MPELLSEGIKGACAHCTVAPILTTARSRFQSQFRFSAKDNAPQSELIIPQDGHSGEYEVLIMDPAPLIGTAEAHLQQQPCKFVQTGNCELGQFLIQAAVNQRLG